MITSHLPNSTHSSLDYNHPVTLQILIAFLQTGRLLDQASSIFLMITILLALNMNPVFSTMSISLSFLLGVVEKYYAWRVALDANLFKTLKEFSHDTAIFDQSLGTFLGSKSRSRVERSMESRWKGAKCLFLKQCILLILQTIVMVGLIALYIVNTLKL